MPARMITYRSRLLRRGEIWFDGEPAESAGAVDWLFHHQRPRPIAGAKVTCYHSYLIDLTQSREQLEARVEKDTAYKIRRARDRDAIVCECRDPRNEAVMGQFEGVYNRFAAAKGLAPFHRPRMESLAAAGLLDISSAR